MPQAIPKTITLPSFFRSTFTSLLCDCNVKGFYGHKGIVVHNEYGMAISYL